MRNIKKIFGLIFIVSTLFAACSKKPHIREVGHRGNASSIKREKINLENAAFKDLGLPLPENNYGRKVPYLIPVNENFDENFSIFKKYDENKALAFFKNRNITGYGDNSSYWRWKTSIKKSEWYDNVRKKVSALSKSSYKNVFVLQGNKWVHKKMGYLSPVKNIKIIGRGPSGIVTHILVETTSNKYLITKEWNVRKIFATHHNLYGARAKQNYNMKKPIVRNVSSLPSANLAFEDDGKYIHIYGGGFGHGVGMCQYGVPDLVKDG
ncbi:MAG: stage II sporulation protein SpoIID, partial [Fusobacterium sp.]|nr:stage II sporulation protein SpoIID [Fusobacterium sp.]